MSWFTGIMVYAVLWWLVLFMVLPFGVRNIDEAGADLEPGQDRGAPVVPRMWAKVAWTTVISAVVFGIGYGIVASGLFDLRAFLDPTIRAN